MRRLIQAAEFAAHASDGNSCVLVRLMPQSVELGATVGDRCIRYCLSDPSVGRDGHTIAADAWDLANYRANPVFLWAHDAEQPPIGRMIEIGAAGDRLMGTVRYPERDEYAFGDTVYRLVRGGYINATSAGWSPLDWRISKDPARLGGVDFTRVEALEFSQVPIPALPSALAAARGAGIDTGPLYDWAEQVLDRPRGDTDLVTVPRAELEAMRRAAKMPRAKTRADGADWKVGGARDLPVADSERAWDGPAAAGRMLDAATSGEGADKKIDAAKAKRGFLLYDAANTNLRGSYKEPFADIEGGSLKAIPSGIRAAASRLPQTKDIPQDAKDGARAIIDHYEAKMKDGAGGDGAKRASWAALRRDLSSCGWLAQLVDALDCLQEGVEWEAAMEGDGSPLPERLRAVVVTLGQLLIDMTAEEVAEMLDDDEAEDGGTAPQQALRALGRAFTRAAPSADGDLVVQIGIAQAREMIAGMERAGRVLSAGNETKLRDAHDHMTRACDLVRGVYGPDTADGADSADSADDDTAGEAAQMRARKAAARRRQLKLAAP